MAPAQLDNDCVRNPAVYNVLVKIRNINEFGELRCTGVGGFKCGEIKPYTDKFFRKSSAGGLTTTCLECARAYLRDYHKRAYCPKRARESHLKKTYGMDGSAYASLSSSQGGVCAICEQRETWSPRQDKEPAPLSVDHCHKTGRIRGLVCNSCNTRIGQVEFFEENKEFFEKVKAHVGSGAKVLARPDDVVSM